MAAPWATLPETGAEVSPLYNDRGKGRLPCPLKHPPGISPLPPLFISLKISMPTDCGVFLQVF